VFGNSWRIGRIAGVEIRVDTSWVIIAVLVTYSLYLEFTASFRALAPAIALALALGVAILFFGSVLAHEMAHALVAKSRGIPVRGITLFLFGGATHAKAESRRARDEFVISVVGPLTSLALGGLFLGLGALAGDALAPPVIGGLRYLGRINVILAIFNLLPGFPLDGGRVLRSAVWHATGSLQRATRVASISGQVVGYLMIAAGAAFVFLAENLVGGLWLAAIGWFLAQAARASYTDVNVRGLLDDVEAEDVMERGLISIPPDITLRDAVDGYFMRHDHAAFPVAEDGHSLGLLTLRAVKRVPQEEWGNRRVREAMGGLGEQLTVTPTTRMGAVLSKLQDGEVGRVLVVRDGDVVGIITPSDVARWLQRWRAVHADGTE
jgi:Zn-dependent protease/CBS domain-containing protein